MALDRAEIERSLKRKGFVLDDGRDHRYYYHERNGRRTGVYTKVSTGSQYRTLHDSTLSKIKKQLRLSTSDELHDFVNCPMTLEMYNAILMQRGQFS